MLIGAQLYTLRDYCKNTADFAETLKKVADIGFKTVQVSGTCAYESLWLKEQLDINGLSCDLTHFNFNRITDETEKVVEEHDIFKCKYIGVGSMPGFLNNGVDDYINYVSKGLPAARKMSKLGSLLMYHNHDVEYRVFEGMTYMDRLAVAFPAELMGFTLDSYWIKFAGADPVEEFKKFSGRIPCVHFKDMAVLTDGTKRYAPVGSGILDFEKIAEACVTGGTKFAYIEQDDCYGEDPFKCLESSYKYCKSLGLE